MVIIITIMIITLLQQQSAQRCTSKIGTYQGWISKEYMFQYHYRHHHHHCCLNENDDTTSTYIIVKMITMNQNLSVLKSAKIISKWGGIFVSVEQLDICGKIQKNTFQNKQ